MALPYCKVVLLEGDPNLVLPVLSTIKKSWFPKGATSADWVHLEPPETKVEEKEYYRTIDSELSSDIYGEPKVLILRGFPATKPFREWIVKMIPLVEAPKTLVIWDIDGVIEKSDDPEWKAIRNTAKGHGQCLAYPLPLNAQKKNKFKKMVDVYSDEEKVHYIMHSFQSKGCSITFANANILLSMIGADRGMIDSEVERLLLFCNGKSIDEHMLRSTVLPVAQDYPIYRFYTAFNSGNYGEMMSAANALLNMARERKDGKLKAPPKPETVMMLCLKQCHWQLVAADLLLKGKDLHSGLRKMGASKDAEIVRKKIWGKIRYHLKEDAQAKCALVDEKKADKEEQKTGQELLQTDWMINGIVDSIQLLLRQCPPNTKNAHAWAFGRAIDRFLIAQQAFVSLRAAKKDSQFSLMGEELRKLSL